MATTKTQPKRKPTAKTSAKPSKAKRPYLLAKPAASTGAMDAPRLIDARIAELGDWRGLMLAKLRKLIHDADPDIVETWKWRGVPIFEHDGIVCTGETHKMVVKTTFAKGAKLRDPKKLFNASLEGNIRRAIDFREGDKIDDKAFKDLVREAVNLNAVKAPPRPRKG